ncbi:DUF397 domain-containing protein [Streptomyces acidicola]|uniref:DUF397 domain-containing protein n=1 Tax=Streptomyces acidicola TaxID=2596892 RepID=A0A5N8WSM9_9ACTN|nr:DUF397 domain-containing protein [Streptomyces acidicola]MPY50289.1 DUF397 domain-containing protein [Streptomyces acidicola]
MTDASTTIQFSSAVWLKSSYSAANNECVEVAFHSRLASIRDSKALQRGKLTVSRDAFAAFIERLKAPEDIHRVL